MNREGNSGMPAIIALTQTNTACHNNKHHNLPPPKHLSPVGGPCGDELLVCGPAALEEHLLRAVVHSADHVLALQ